MTQPRVTVLVPTIGRTRYLRATIDSLEAQTFRDFEILILDNASPPDAVAIYDDFARRDSRVRILRVEDRLPMFANFNRGVASASGDYICFFFDDDVYEPGFVEREMRFLDEHPTAGFAGSDYVEIDENGNLLRRRRWVTATELWDGRRYIDFLFRRGRNMIGTPGLMFRRIAIPNPLFPEMLSIHFGDFIMLMRIAEHWSVGLIAEPLIRIRRHAGAASSIKGSEAMPLLAKHMLKYREEFASRHPDEKGRIRRMLQHTSRAVRLGLVWSWLDAVDDEEAAACILALQDSAHRWTAYVLRFLQRSGLRRVRRSLAPLLRKIGEATRI